MPAALILRDDFDAPTMRSFAKRCRNAKQSRRLLAIAAVYDGMSRVDAAKVGGPLGGALLACRVVYGPPDLTGLGSPLQ